MTDFEGRLAALRTRFLAGLPVEAESLASALAEEDWAAARRIAHGLAGRSGLFGFDELGQFARRCDEAEAAAFEAEARRLAAALRALIQT